MDTKLVYKHSRAFIGGTPSVFAYYNSDRKKSIDILTSSGTQYAKVDIFSTLGLSNVDIGLTSDKKQVRVELIGVSTAGDEICANILATACFEIMDKKECYFGMILPDIVSEYDQNSETKHIMLLSPVFWDGYHSLETEEEIVTWLLCVPITDAEKVYVEENGIDSFEDILSQQDGDITDRTRKSFL